MIIDCTCDTLTRDDILRRLAEALDEQDCRYAHAANSPPLSADVALCVITALRAVAREPGGAEAVAEALGMRVQITPSAVCVSRRRCDCSGRIVAADKEPTP